MFSFFRRSTAKMPPKIYTHKKARLLMSLVQIANDSKVPADVINFRKLIKKMDQLLTDAKKHNEAGHVAENKMLKLIAQEVVSCQNDFRFKNGSSTYYKASRAATAELRLVALSDFITLMNKETATHHYARKLIAILYRYKELIGGLGIIDIEYKTDIEIYFAQLDFSKFTEKYRGIFQSKSQYPLFQLEERLQPNQLPPFTLGMTDSEFEKHLNSISAIPLYPEKQIDLLENITHLLWSEPDLNVCQAYCKIAINHPTCYSITALLNKFEIACDAILHCEELIEKTQQNLDLLIEKAMHDKITCLNEMNKNVRDAKQRLNDISDCSDSLFKSINRRRNTLLINMNDLISIMNMTERAFKSGSAGLRSSLKDLIMIAKLTGNPDQAEGIERIVLNYTQQALEKQLNTFPLTSIIKALDILLDQRTLDRFDLVIDKMKDSERKFTPSTGH